MATCDNCGNTVEILYNGKAYAMTGFFCKKCIDMFGDKKHEKYKIQGMEKTTNSA